MCSHTSVPKNRVDTNAMGDANSNNGKNVRLTTEHKSLLILLVSAMAYSVMGCFVKLCTSSGLPSTEIVLFRAVFQMTLVVGAMFYYTQNGTIMDSMSSTGGTSSPESCNPGDNEDRQSGSEGIATRATTEYRYKPLIWNPFGSRDVCKIVVVRGIVGGAGFCLYYYTISALPLGDAVTILSLSPVITVLMAKVALNEKITRTHALAALSSVAGSVFLVQPSFLFVGDGSEATNADGLSSNTGQQHQPRQWGYLSGLLGACCGASVYILIRKAGKKGVHTLNLLFSWCVFGLIFSIAILITGGNDNTLVMPSSTALWWYVWWNCVFGTLAHFLMNYAARMAPAGVASIIRSSSIVWSYLLEVLIFGQMPQAWTILGVGLILASLLGIAWEQQQVATEQKSHDDDDTMPLQSQMECDGGNTETRAASTMSEENAIADPVRGGIEMQTLIR